MAEEALEVAPHGVTVNCVAPGTVATPMIVARFGESNPDGEAEYSGVITRPLRLAMPEVANAVLYFCGPYSDHVTGMTIHVNGGTYMP